MTLHSEESKMGEKLSASNPSYKNLHVHGQRCFEKDGTVLAVGGLATTDGTPSAAPLPAALVHMWTRDGGWEPCSGVSHDFQPVYPAAALLQTFDNGTEEVVLFGGYNARDTVPQGSDSMLAVGCRVPWGDCTCGDVSVREIAPTPSQQRTDDQGGNTARPTLDEFSWPLKRTSACGVRMGNSRMVMYGGHLNGTPRLTVWAVEMRQGAPTWYEIGDATRSPVIPQLPTYGSVCFRFEDALIVVGGSGRGSLTDEIQVMIPSCNTGFGASNNSYATGTCDRCDDTSFRRDFSQPGCTSCPRGTRRPNARALGLDIFSCRVCDPSYCVHASRSQILFGGSAPECRCHCRAFYHGDRCNQLNTRDVALVTLLPLAVMAAVLISGAAYRRVMRLRTTSALQEQLLSEKDSELLELHASWEVAPHDLIYHRSIGEGGFGEVWLATWLVRDELVAVKKLHTALLDEETLASFQNEIRFMKTLRHRCCFWG